MGWHFQVFRIFSSPFHIRRKCFECQKTQSRKDLSIKLHCIAEEKYVLNATSITHLEGNGLLACIHSYSKRWKRGDKTEKMLPPSGSKRAGEAVTAEEGRATQPVLVNPCNCFQ